MTKHTTYTTVTLHLPDENWKLWSKAMFTCDFSDGGKNCK
jgi:hypothetical protein